MSKLQTVTEKTIAVEKYSDIFTDFSIHPTTGQLNKKTNENAIKQSVRNLLLTNKYERPFHPEIGSNLKALLFENMTPGITLEVEEYVKDVINNYEPRAALLATNLSFMNDNNAVNVEVKFSVVNSDDISTITFVLSRNR